MYIYVYIYTYYIYISYMYIGKFVGCFSKFISTILSKSQTVTNIAISPWVSDRILWECDQ